MLHGQTVRRLRVKILTLWLKAIMRRIGTTHEPTNFSLMMMIGEVMAFPPFLTPDNDLPDDTCAKDDPGGAEG